MRAPQVSVVMPCYNHGQFADQSVDSVLRQTVSDLELIIVDDASSDGSPQSIRKWAEKDTRVKVIIHEKNRGPSASRNDGLRAARGEFVAFCDADDLWKPAKLERQIQILESHPEYDITYCDAEIIDEKGKLSGQLFSQRHPLPPVPSGNLFEALCRTNFVNTQTVLARRQPLGDGLLFDEKLRLAEDWWQWIRLARHHRFIYEPSAQALYRVHSRSTGATQWVGFRRSHCKVAGLILRSYKDIEPGIQADIWYRIGRQLCLLHKRRRGCGFILKGLRYGLKGRLPIHTLARMSARLALEWSQRLVLSRH